MAATSRLRVYVTVPQALSSLIQVGEQADLTVDQFPGRKFPAHVVGTAGAISSDAKRLLTELEVPNPTGELSSGTYAQITLDIPIDDRGVIIPAETLLLRSGQPASRLCMQTVRWQYRTSASCTIWAPAYTFPAISLSRNS
jgi:multidrug efflux pump subunit AcrA (membrane-fusion protein)